MPADGELASGDGLLAEAFVTWVNVSGKQLSAGGRQRARPADALERAGLPPARLGLEVTETAIVPRAPAGERARAELEELHELGVRIAIDDFGTGFSSLGQLRRFPIDVIKVDRSFIQGVEHDAKDAAITANSSASPTRSACVAIAEGIESDGQLASVRELGCDLAQGYLFARPAPPAEIEALLTGDSRSPRPPERYGAPRGHRVTHRRSRHDPTARAGRRPGVRRDRRLAPVPLR